MTHKPESTPAGNYWARDFEEARPKAAVWKNLLWRLYAGLENYVWRIGAGVGLIKTSEEITPPVLTEIDNTLKTMDLISFERMNVDKDKYVKYKQLTENTYKKYNYFLGRKRHEDKVFQHFMTTEVLDIGNGSVCVDIGAHVSPYAGILRETRRAVVYSYDALFDTDPERFLAGGKNNRIELPDGTADFAFAHCALDNFEGNDDTEIMGEICRILRPGGRFAVIPLYLRTRPENLVNVSARGVRTDREAVKCWLPPTKLRFGRHYSPETFRARLVKPSAFSKTEVFRVSNLDEIGAGLYCHHVAVFTK